MSFKVIQPVIVGTFKTDKYEGPTAEDAVKKFWKEFSKLVVNEIFKFFVSLEDENGQIYHFMISEKREEGDDVKTEITDITEKIKTSDPSEMWKGAREILNEENDKIVEGSKKKDTSLSGGKEKSSSSSSSTSSFSSDSDSDDDVDFSGIRRKMYKSPIVYFGYAPNLYGIKNVFIPTFIKPITPYVELLLRRDLFIPGSM